MKPQCVSIIQHLTSKDIKIYVLNQFETLRMHVALLSILSSVKLNTFLSSFICNCSPFPPKNNRTTNSPKVIFTKV